MKSIKKILYKNTLLCSSLFLLSTGVNATSSTSLLQQIEVTVSLSNSTLKDIFHTIEQQTDLVFVYNNKDVNDQELKSVSVEGRSVNDVLNKVLANTGLVYSIENNHIILKKAPSSLSVNQQNKTIKGKVLDDLGVPVIGANVVVKGTTVGTITDIDGNFTLEVPANAVLEVSYVGYATLDVKVGNQRNLSITMKEDSHALQELVVVGYGTQKKATLTGAVAAIASDEIMTTKNENVENMLTGKIPGVRIVQKSSEPGDFNNSFEIRGMGNPLVIVDGVPRDNMNRINPNEIESISILKDASAAVYGVRAANGVVLITTKKGKGGKVEFDYNGSVGWQTPSGLPETMNAVEYMTLMNENAVNNGRDILYKQSDFDPYLNGTKQSTDWAASALRNAAPQTQHNFSATGSTEKVNYFANFGYLKQEGFWKTGDLDYERFNVRSNVSAQLTDDLKLEVLLGGMMDTKNASAKDTWTVFKSIWTQVPIWPLYANDREGYYYNAADSDHPMVITDSDLYGYSKNQMKQFQSTFNVEYNIPFVDGLKAKASYSYDYTLWDEKRFEKKYNLYTYDPETDKYNTFVGHNPSNVWRKKRDKVNTLLQLSLDYHHVFNELHDVSVLALYEESTASMDNFYARRELSLDVLDELFAGNAQNQEGSSHPWDLWDFATKGFVGRLKYDFASKYMAEFSFRYDGSSKFAKGSQWGFFPVGQIGWRLSEESFIKDNENLSFINNLKLRASYGKMGDDSAAAFQFLSGFDYPSGGFLMNGNYVNAVSLRGMPNPNITWFTAKMLNIGVDADLWKGLLGVQFDVFTRDRDGLLATRHMSLPGTVGANLPQENLEGDMTKGFELALTHKNSIGDFNYYFSGNVSYARTHWTDKERARSNNSYRNWRENYTDRYGDLWWGHGYLGQFQSYDEVYGSAIQDGKGNSKLRPGDYKYEDWNGDGVIDGNDEHPIATTGYPIVNFGFTIGGDWKGFDLNMVFQGAAKSNIKFPEQLEHPLCWDRNGLNMFMDRWHQVDMSNPDSEWIPGYFASTNTGETTNYWDSERSVQNASYVRLKSLEFGYTLPENILAKVGLKRTRIYFSGYNLLTFTGIKHVDPEHPSDTYGYLYPLSKTYNIGVNLTF